MISGRYSPQRLAVSSLVMLAGLAPLGVATLAHAAITGTVVNAGDQTPIAGALVSIQASDTEVLTDAQGAFTIPDNGGTDLVIVGAMKGYFNASVIASDPAADLVIALDVVPVENNPDYEFIDPGTCGDCHADQYGDWFGTPMANAGINTWVYDIYSGDGTEYGSGGFVYLEDSVFAEENPASECASCHQPEPWVNNPFSALGDLAGGDPGIAHGISCDVCHKIANVDESKPNFPGIHPDSVTMTLPNDPGWAIQYGGLGDVDFFQVGEMRASHQPQLTAVVCGACHQDKNDHDSDGDYEDEGGIISEPTFIEWLESPYADPNSDVQADCVDCHMPATGAPVLCNQLPLMQRPDGDARSHEILGTTPAFLDNAVTMELDTQVLDGALTVGVTITNDQTGHHVPTGVTIRNMILLVEASHVADGSALTFTGDQVVHDLGGVDGPPEEGYYGGLPGKLYAKLNEDAEGNGPTFFTDAVAITFDNRIPALESDVSEYTFESAVGGEVEVRARLIYRRSWRALLDQKQWIEDGHGEPLEDIAEPHFGHLMEEASAQATVPAPPDCPEPPCDDTGDGDGDEGTDTGGEGSDTGESGTEPPADGGEDGCGCSAEREPAPLGAAALFLFVVAGLGRRRYSKITRTLSNPP